MNIYLIIFAVFAAIFVLAGTYYLFVYFIARLFVVWLTAIFNADNIKK